MISLAARAISIAMPLILALVLHGCGTSSAPPPPSPPQPPSPQPAQRTEDICRGQLSSSTCEDVQGCRYHIVSAWDAFCWCETPGAGCQRVNPPFSCNAIVTKEECDAQNASFYGCRFGDFTKMCSCAVEEKGCGSPPVEEFV